MEDLIGGARVNRQISSPSGAGSWRSSSWNVTGEKWKATGEKWQGTGDKFKVYLRSFHLEAKWHFSWNLIDFSCLFTLITHINQEIIFFYKFSWLCRRFVYISLFRIGNSLKFGGTTKIAITFFLIIRLGWTQHHWASFLVLFNWIPVMATL